MSESESTEVVDQETKLENNPRKRIRHRKKQLYENILKQMEFYFSDANLSKDRFLGDLVKSDPFVPIETFLKFNKIGSMTQDVTDIAKAMKHSTILELSDNRLKVRRKTPILPYDAEARTVYVESIPVTAGREWLQRVFSDYGKVVYISLPKFKNSTKIKGYGFIEFDKSEEAQKCIQEFTKMGCKLPTSMPPEDLSSIKMFSVENQSDIENKEVKEEYETPKKKARKNKERKPHKSLELKLDGESDNEIKKVTTPVEDKPLDSESKDEATSQDEEKDEKSPRKKKGRKRTAKDKNKIKKLLPEAPKGALWGLQILSKCEWKKLRNKYLDLQRKYMKELKANYHNRRYTYSAIPAPAAAPLDVESEIIPGATDGPKDVTTLEQIPGVFVKEVLSEPCLDVKLTKRTIRTNIHVQHVDVKEGQTEVIIRFDTSKAADEYCSGAGSHAQLLTGAEESAQWARALAARSNKRARGRERVLARAPPPAGPAPASPQPTHTHIRFDDE